jgi:hypothetical protein
MIITYAAMVLGMLVGYLAAGPLGGVLGTLLGAASGLLLAGSRDAVQRPGEGAGTVTEQEVLLCIPKGQIAQATFVRDARDGRWLDVERCSLCAPEDEVGCAKRCLHLLRDTLPPRKHPVPQSAPST